MPKCSIEGCISRPIDARTIGISSIVFELESRACGVERGEGLDVRVEGVGFVDAPVACVDEVAAECGVDVGERCDAGTYPSGSQGVAGRLICAVVGIEDVFEVFVGVAKEDVGDDVR